MGKVNIMTRIYQWLRRLTSPHEERNEYSAGYWQGKVRKMTLTLCQNLNGRILEVGCGEGLFLSQLIKQNSELEIWGIDDNATRLSQAEKKIEENNFRKVNLSLQNATSLSFENEYFDTVICINVFFNMPSFESVKESLTEIRRVCKKSGRIIFDFRNALNPLIILKYKLARYYDATVKGLPLKAYNLKQIEPVLNNLNLVVIRKRFIGFPGNRLSPIIILEAQKR